MKKRIAALLTLVAFLFGSVGCVTVSEENKGAATGAGIGALTGAVTGALVTGRGSHTAGAIIGGLAGALVGGAIGHYAVDRKRSAEQTASAYNYQPESGTVVRIEGCAATPANVDPGGTVNLEATYAVMAPSSDMQVAITESREVTLNGELVASPEVTVNRTGGTYLSSIPLILPADAQPGRYKIVTTIRTASGKDARETSFTVQ